MKIMFLCNISLRLNGPSVHLLEDIITQCIRDGNSVVIAMKDTGEATRAIDEYILKSQNVEIIKVPFQNAGKSDLVGRYIQDAKYAYKIAKLYRQIENIDVVFLQSCNTSAFHIYFLNRYLKSIPIVYNVQDMFPENTCAVGVLNEKSIKYKILQKIQEYSYKRATLIIAISYDMQNSLKKYKEVENKLHVIHNWAYEKKNIEPKDDNFRKDYLGIKDSSYLVLYAGNIGVAQNVEMIINAANQLKKFNNIVFTIVGNGARREIIKRMIDQFDLSNVYLLDSVSQEISSTLYESAEINIIPLKANMINYAFPSKTARCLMSNSIVITCFDKKSEVVKQLESKTDVVNVAPDNYNSLAQTILKFYNKEQIYDYQKAFVFAKENFDKDKNVKKYCHLIYKATKR